MSIDAALRARYNGSGPIAGDTILPVLPGAPMMLTQNVNLPLGLVNEAIVKFYGFPEHSCTRDNIITASGTRIHSRRDNRGPWKEYSNPWTTTCSGAVLR